MSATEDEPPHAEPAAPIDRIELAVRGDFVRVLDQLGASLVVNTRPSNIVLLGAADGELTIASALISQPMGLAVGGGRIAVATARSITVFANLAKMAAGYPPRPDYHDAFFAPRMLLFTGACSMHDMAFSRDGAIIGANTNFSCVCRVDGRYSFTPLWRPTFISELRAEDRCHLNGFAGENDELRYVTALSQSDTKGGWRETDYGEGVLIEAASNRILRGDLCMPHSPRLVEGQLYVLNGAMGEVLRVDRQSGRSAVLARLPGFTHGLCAVGNVLFVGLSLDRVSRMKGPPPVAQRVKQMMTGVVAVERTSGRVLGAVEFSSGVTEVYDVQPLAGVRRAGIQSLIGSDGITPIDTPNTSIWMKRETDDATALQEILMTDNYQLHSRN